MDKTIPSPIAPTKANCTPPRPTQQKQQYNSAHHLALLT